VPGLNATSDADATSDSQLQCALMACPSAWMLRVFIRSALHVAALGSLACFSEGFFGQQHMYTRLAV